MSPSPSSGQTDSCSSTDSPDLKFAKEVADFIGTVHHSYTYTLEEGMDAVRDVIYHLETFDVTTIRAATPMFLMSRKVRCTGQAEDSERQKTDGRGLETSVPPCGF